MPKFAVIKNENVINTIIAESLEIAESVTGENCVEYTIEPAEAGGLYIDGKFIQRQPYPSWTLEDYKWVPPISYPKSSEPRPYVWDEEKQSWTETK